MQVIDGGRDGLQAEVSCDSRSTLSGVQGFAAERFRHT